MKNLTVDSISFEKEFEGKVNYPEDDAVEDMLEEHFKKHDVSKKDIWRYFQIYTRRVYLKRFVCHYELFRNIINIPGDIVELGVYRGATLLTWAHLLEIRNMGDRAKKVVGFENFSGFTELDLKDGVEDYKYDKKLHGCSGSRFKSQLLDIIDIFNADRFIPYKERIELVEGDIEQTIPEYVENNPGMRISLLNIDCDTYRPSKVALETLWPLITKGGIVVLDEYSIRPWEGESRAVDEFFEDKAVEIRKFDWISYPGAYIVKK